MADRSHALLTVHEAADYLRSSPGALFTQRYRGEKPGVLGVKVGRRLVYRLTDIEKYLDDQLAAQGVEVG